ncbi:MAG: hypothetical protein M1828_003281 [Chrysothrix sp. TS-e1954]|nr:MAG: hypothetical protein M1828_003281 [Chrysothrix sp. TS-e1954]
MLFAKLLTFVSLLCYCVANDPTRPYPLPDASLATTPLLNHSKYLSGLDDTQWYLDNIPFVDLPDKTLQDVYYYRTSVIKRHLKYTREGHGWVFTEFIQPVAWASKFQTIPDSAGHQILEARWLRDPRYVKDTVQLYTRAGVEAITSITYTHFVHQATYEASQAFGDKTFLQSQLDGLINIYGLWNVTRDTTTGLYHRTPLLDAQEFSLPGYEVGGPDGMPVQQYNNFQNDFNIIDLGPETYRISFNSYMVAAARSISNVAAMAGNTSLSQEWNMTASTQQSAMQKTLYDDDINFWIDVIQGSNQRVVGRQSIGYYPYRFDVGTSDSVVKGLEAGLDDEHFLTEFGPTTLEQTSPYYTALKNITYCCLWQGQSWPFSTSVYLTTLAGLARENRSSIATPEFFQSALSTYARTNYKNGVPFTAEVHYPTIDAWSGDTTNHSENYLHSTYIDNVFTNLLGIIPTFDDRLEMRPPLPSNWSYFAVENLPYHGTLLKILWDATGSHYSGTHEPGLSIYSCSQLIHHQSTLAPFNASLATTPLNPTERYVNILANPNAPYSTPNVTASYTFSSNGDISPYEAWKLIDGLLWYDETPDNRWTANQSSVPYSTLTVTLPRPRTFSSLSLAVYTDVEQGGIIDCPEALHVIDARTGSVLAERSPWTSCTRNALNTVLFSTPGPDKANSTTQAMPSNSSNPYAGAEVTTDQLTIVLTSKLRLSFALSELQVWIPAPSGPRYELEDGLLGTFIGGFEGRAAGMNGTKLPPTGDSTTNGGVSLTKGGWVEIAGVEAKPGMGSMAVLGKGGSVIVGTNFLRNETVSFEDGDEVMSKNVSANWLSGGNVVTVWYDSGSPFVDAIIVDQ